MFSLFQSNLYTNPGRAELMRLRLTGVGKVGMFNLPEKTKPARFCFADSNARVELG